MPFLLYMVLHCTYNGEVRLLLKHTGIIAKKK